MEGEHVLGSPPDMQPGALLAELDSARADFERAERRARTYLAERGILDQTHLDVATAIRRLTRHSELG
jgi:hypothetical protein